MSIDNLAHQATPRRLALLTPSYRSDLERFGLLRKSLEAQGCNWPHIAVIQTEDLALFRNKFGNDSHIQWLSSADVVDPLVESRRLQTMAMASWQRKLRRSLNKRLGWFPAATYDGWHVQQIVKLAVPLLTDFDAYVSLDSDVIASGNPQVQHFYRDGRFALHAASGHNFAHWADAAARVLGLPIGCNHGTSYVSHPFLFETNAVRQLHQHLERLHARPWWEALLAQRAGDLSEFTVYGSFVQNLLPRDQYFRAIPNERTRWVIAVEDQAQVKTAIAEAFADTQTDYLVLQAHRHWPIEPHLPYVQDQLDAVAKSVHAGPHVSSDIANTL